MVLTQVFLSHFQNKEFGVRVIALYLTDERQAAERGAGDDEVVLRKVPLQQVHVNRLAARSAYEEGGTGALIVFGGDFQSELLRVGRSTREADTRDGPLIISASHFQVLTISWLSSRAAKSERAIVGTEFDVQIVGGRLEAPATGVAIELPLVRWCFLRWLYEHQLAAVP